MITARQPVSRRAHAPATTLADVPKLCDPYTPLDPVEDSALRQDLGAIRGGDRLSGIVRAIRRSGGLPTLHFLSGHLGSGKTTELLAVRRRLEQRDDDGGALHVLLVDADLLLSRQNVELEDILVAIWSVIAEEAAAAAATALLPLWKDRVRVALKKAAFDPPDVLKDGLSAILKTLKQAPPEETAKLRGGLGSVTPALIEGLNRAFDKLRGKESHTAESMEIAVLIDNLEKQNPVDRKTVERLYAERLVALKDLDAHIVLTIPIYIVFSALGGTLKSLYGGETVVLPMVKVSDRLGNDDAAGLDAMVQLLARRVEPGLFAGGAEALREIARQSGGCIRDALQMTAGASNDCDRPPIPSNSVETAARSLQAHVERALPERWVPWLRRIQELNQFPHDISEEDKREMLRHLFVLEYQNGTPDAWFAVHPLVRRCRKYNAAT